MKRPSMHTCPLSLAKPYPITDALEIFKGDAASGAFGDCNERLGNAVVHILSETGFSLRNGLETAADGAWAFAFASPSSCRTLQRFTSHSVVLATSFDIVSGMQVAIASRGNVGHAEIDSEEIRCWRLCTIRQIDHHQQEPLAVAASHEIALTFGIGETLCLISPHDHWDDDAAGQGQQRNTVNALEAHHPLIEWHRCEWSETRTFGFVSLVRFTDLSDTAHCHLRRKSEPLAQCCVMCLLKRNLVGHFRRKCLASQPGCACVEGTQRRFKRFSLVLVWEKLGLQCQFHVDTDRRIPSIRQQVSAKGGTFPGVWSFSISMWE